MISFDFFSLYFFCFGPFGDPLVFPFGVSHMDVSDPGRHLSDSELEAPGGGERPVNLGRKQNRCFFFFFGGVLFLQVVFFFFFGGGGNFGSSAG